ncbi:MAG: malonyl-CoA decarboxylase [Deltaproteobacteria bacterium]|nr:malonyl-CoA decarboxylase [Deltaproteobacteria bacterium]
MHRRAKKAIELCRALMSERGEVSGAALAREALSAYDGLSEAEAESFFALLESDFSPDPRQVIRAADGYRDYPSQENLNALQRAVEPPRQELFRRLNMAPGGTAALVAMRHRVLRGIELHPEWSSIAADLGHLFTSWFNRGFLTLERIDWHTAAMVLEKLIQYEAVHEIGSWKDLRRRLEADRRCFAFFHPALPGQPIIFIEVALTKGISTSVQPLLDLESPVSAPESADSAVFYSITSCQDGLRGIPFGNLLIKQVVHQLGREFPRITHFATLSPVPGFRPWLASVADSLHEAPGGREVTETLKQLQGDDWFKRKDMERLQSVLMPLCAYYLLYTKQGVEPADRVARFHLGNGAQLERINWLADVSTRGLHHSAGLMVNYLYRPGDVEANHESYVREHSVVASRQLKRLARDCPLFQRQEIAHTRPKMAVEIDKPAIRDEHLTLTRAK